MLETGFESEEDELKQIKAWEEFEASVHTNMVNFQTTSIALTIAIVINLISKRWTKALVYLIPMQHVLITVIFMIMLEETQKMDDQSAYTFDEHY